MPSVRDLEVNDPAKLLQKIKQEFPNVSWKKFKFINHGWDHEVVILDDNLVFRFPASSEYLPGLRAEAKLLDYLHGKIDFPMPKYKYVASDGSFVGYSMLPGLELSQKKFANLASADKALLAKQLARFLTQLHSIDIKDIQHFNVPRADLVWEASRLREYSEEYLHSSLNDSEYRRIREVLATLEKTVGGQLPRTLTHNDITPKHLLWDERESRLALIDFSDRSISDPARDFAELFEYGVAFVKGVYEIYNAKKDDTFLERALIYYKQVGIYSLVNSFLTEKLSFEDAKHVFDDAINQSGID